MIHATVDDPGHDHTDSGHEHEYYDKYLNVTKDHDGGFLYNNDWG